MVEVTVALVGERCRRVRANLLHAHRPVGVDVGRELVQRVRPVWGDVDDPEGGRLLRERAHPHPVVLDRYLPDLPLVVLADQGCFRVGEYPGRLRGRSGREPPRTSCHHGTSVVPGGDGGSVRPRGEAREPDGPIARAVHLVPGAVVDLDDRLHSGPLCA